MERNLKNSDITQFFSDTTYYAVAPFSKGSRSRILLGFDQKIFKTLLCCIAIIYNENKETILKILDYLNLKYGFIPKVMTLDLGRGPYSALKEKFKLCRLYPCFFHIMLRLIKHVPEIKSKNKKIKLEAEELLINIKYLFFINNEKLEYFYSKIKKKFNNNFKKFIKYFDNTYMFRGLFSDRNWNYYNYSINTNSTDYYFFTNNICESNNKILNSKFIGYCNSYYSFFKAIKNLIDYYKTKEEYKDKYLCITRALDYYSKTSKNYNILNKQNYNNILATCINYRKNNNLPLDNKLEYNNLLFDSNFKLKETITLFLLITNYSY